MKTYKPEELVLAEAIHPGEMLKDELKARGMKQKELSTLTGIQAPILNNIIKGVRSITAQQSILIGEALGIEPDYFYTLQSLYDMDKAKIEKRVREQTAAINLWDILVKLISVAFFKKVGVIKEVNIAEDIKSVFAIYGAANLEDMINLRSTKSNMALCRKSEKLQTDDNALFSWKYFCIFQSGKQPTLENAFYKAQIPDVVKELNNLFYDGKDVRKRTEEILNRYGIKLVVAEKYGKIPVDGLSFWEGENPTIALTLRHKRIDNFAFTVFHELGHILWHLEKDKGEAISPYDSRNEELENQADKFAQENLVPMNLWKNFMSAWSKTSMKLEPFINAFSRNYRINPRVVYGRFCKEKDNYRHKVSIPSELT